MISKTLSSRTLSANGAFGATSGNGERTAKGDKKTNR